MTCFAPVKVWPGRGRVVYSAGRSYPGAVPFFLPCGQCLGCRLSKARDWSTRMTHEAQLHDDNIFITLTYNDDNLPEDYSVSTRVMQLFMKRLRKQYFNIPIRFFLCGEYGEAGRRPHYHLILFGFRFPDQKAFRIGPRGEQVWRSATLERLWPYGFSEYGEFTPQAAGYVARYTLKKVSGKQASEHYKVVHPVTGELVTQRREFATMSRRPGIGGDWWLQYASDLYPHGFAVIDGQKVPVPRFYKRKLAELEQLKATAKAKAHARKHAKDSTPERLADRAEATRLRIQVLSRKLESDT